MKKIFLLACLGLCLNIKAQTRSMIPKNAKMTIIQDRVVTNENKLDSTIQIKKPILVNMMKDLIIDVSSKSGKILDSVALNTIVETNIKPQVEILLDPRKTRGVQKKHVYTFQDSIIKYQSHNSLELENNEVTVINRNSGKQSFYVIKDSTMIRNPSIVASIPLGKNDENTVIKEFRDIKKTIFGYDCFKIVVFKKDNYLDDLNPFGMFDVSEEFIEKYQEHLDVTYEEEIFVTEQIKCKYHPIVNSSQILDKYYPMEIIKKESSIEGSAIRYTLKELDLN